MPLFEIKLGSSDFLFGSVGLFIFNQEFVAELNVKCLELTSTGTSSEAKLNGELMEVKLRQIARSII